MKNLFLVIICCLLITVNLFAQQSADSLKGTYAGLRYSSNQLIGNDTIMVGVIDTLNCKAGVLLCGGQLMPLFTSYNYCNASVQGNYYAYFYGMDSITAIADNYTIQPPCQSAFSIRFYGKRIRSDYGLGINPFNDRNFFVVHPNVANTILNVEYSMLNGSVTLQIKNITGQVVKNIIMNNPQLQIDISKLQNGLYFISLNTNKILATQKIIIQH
jgi:hypothetical protein